MSYELMILQAAVAAAAAAAVAEAALQAANDTNRAQAAAAFKAMADVVEPMADAAMREAKQLQPRGAKRERALRATEDLREWTKAAREVAAALESGDTDALRAATEDYHRAEKQATGG